MTIFFSIQLSSKCEESLWGFFVCSVADGDKFIETSRVLL